MLGDQTLPSMTRVPTNRGNVYLPPSAKTYDTYKAGEPPNFILPNWDCANAGGEMPGGEDPGCDLMEPFAFQGEQQRYPCDDDRGGDVGFEEVPIARHEHLGLGRESQRDEIVVLWIAHHRSADLRVLCRVGSDATARRTRRHPPR
jgi:hypothetical protein